MYFRQFARNPLISIRYYRAVNGSFIVLQTPGDVLRSSILVKTNFEFAHNSFYLRACLICVMIKLVLVIRSAIFLNRNSILPSQNYIVLCMYYTFLYINVYGLSLITDMDLHAKFRIMPLVHLSGMV